MKFEPLYYDERLHMVNPEGDVGVVTLWSKVESALQIIGEAGVDLSKDTSRIAVVANLYGNGLPHMLRNLLYNPQIRYIVIVGKNLSGSREWLLNFFEDGLEEVEFLGAKAFRIKNTNRTIDGLVTREMFTLRPDFEVFGDVGDKKTKEDLKRYFLSLVSKYSFDLARITPLEIPEPAITRFPSEPRSHKIVRDTPMEAWNELIFRLFRFGHRNTVNKKSGPETRIELQNVHIVVEKSMEESDEVLAQYGFSLEKFQGYQARILDSVKPSDIDYTYGNRLRGYFCTKDGTLVDSLEICGQRLRESPDSRHCYIALWDNSRDLPEGTGCPCFVSAFFRQFEGVLTLTATFRSHNAMDAWPENLYGLIAIQRYVADIAGIPCGPITVISHSISIDPSSLEKAKKIAAAKESDEVLGSDGKWGPRMDPNGEFTVTFDREKWELVVQHSFNGMVIGQYIGKNTEEIERQLARDVALSDISHALYLGRELARKEAEMKSARAKEKGEK